MIKFILRILAPLAANGAALYAADKYIEGVEIAGGWEELAVMAAALTLINFLARPALKLILGPIIVITLGLGLLLVNAGVIVILDYLFTGVTITGILPLVYTTLFTTAANFLARIIK